VDLIEKDIILHQMLIELSSDIEFSKHFTFKCGTCLIKCYLGYFRFSEDLDFTWIEQELFDGKTVNGLKAEISDILDRVIALFHKVATKMHIKFIADKKNTRYVQYGGNVRLVTLKLYYSSVILQSESFIKIQLNFTELLLFPITMRKLTFTPISLNDSDLKLLFPTEYNDYSKTINILTYDLKEISCEKIRVILTR
jgi:predicted nucleotidyltransferase component of viral defense system